MCVRLERGEFGVLTRSLPETRGSHLARQADDVIRERDVGFDDSGRVWIATIIRC